MIRVLGANPAMDRTHIIRSLVLGEVNRVSATGSFAGGKGLDVARTLRSLGIPVVAYGFLGGEIGRSIRTACRLAGIEDKHTEIADETRICNIYIEPDAQRATVINEKGPHVTETEREELLQTLISDVEDGDFVVTSGSVPEGIPDTFYGQIIEELSKKNVYTIVDATGSLLKEAIEAKPWMIKPNIQEFKEVYPHVVDEVGLSEQLDLILQGGIENVVVTLGEKGCLCANREGAFYIRVPQVQPVNPIASGDTFIGGFVAKYSVTRDFETSVRFASACAVANTMNVMPEIPEGFDLHGLAEAMKVEIAG